MSPQEFDTLLQTKAKEVQNYALTRFPSTAGNIALRFINGNFRAQGFQGQSFERWKKSKNSGTTLVDTGALRAASYYNTQPGQVTLKNNMPYAKYHNEGFKGTVTVNAHTRNSYAKAKVGTGKFTKKGKERTQTVTFKTGDKQVKAHSRTIDYKGRQFMPTSPNDSPILNNAVERQVARDLETLFK